MVRKPQKNSNDVFEGETHMITRRKVVQTTAGASLLLGAGVFQHAAAAQYPEDAIEMVVAFGPGGSTDVVARALVGQLESVWDQPIDVLNREGGSGATGTASVATAEPDGYTVLMSVTSAGLTNPAIQGDMLPYSWDDFSFISRVTTSPLVVIVSADSPHETLQDLVDAVAADPENHSYSTSGPGGPSTFATAQILNQAGVDPTAIIQVVMGGGADAVTAVAGNNVDFAVQNLSEVVEMVKGGLLKGLAVSNPERVESLPEVPTAEEAGFEEFTFQGWNGVVGPAGMSEEIVTAWNDAVAPIMEDEDFKKQLRDLGLEPAYLPPAEFKEWLGEQYDFATQVVEDLGLAEN